MCSHVAAVLFKVETACRLGYTTQPVLQCHVNGTSLLPPILRHCTCGILC